ncbi:hypothetical protein GE09DRAFT_962291 [Coniochaeta sp. 2T2.1]|nr:hypothetical protein GE09DRAFT_962291 [Coniochaeta sp. 2T2.1]
MAPKKPPVKKKGTASTIKGPKRGGKSSSSSSGVKKPSSKSTSTSTKTPKRPKPERGTATTSQAGSSPTAVTRSSSPAGGSASGSEDESGSDQGIYCLCRGPDNHRFMIACDRCEDWFHGDCIGMDKYTGENLVQRYICPRCTDGKLYVTRYKKTCALERCDRPARMYGDDVVKGESSIFCSAEHRQVWWERLVGTLPKRREGGVLYGDTLTQEEFMGLLGTGKKEGKDGKGWRIGEEPFGVPDNFWETTPPSKVLTEEESSLLSTSVSDRHSLGEEIVLCKKMLQLVDMAVKQREHLISSSLDKPNKSQHLGKDFCGYDYRLDSVGATACFADFLKSPAGEAIFKTGRLPLPGEEGFVVFDDGYVLDAAAPAPGQQQQNGGGVVVNGNNNAAALAGVVCVRRKCKTHAGWSGIHTKNVKHQIKELAAQAKEKLDFEARIRDCAAVRYLRKKRERNSVEVVDAEMEG